MHGQRAVHRDLKPANVVRAEDRWKLGDLGLVRAVEGSLVNASESRGTLLYMAPEVLDDLVGPSVDVWALGVVLQECLTGVLAYTASNEKTLVKALVARAPTIVPNLPPPFDAVVRGCLVKDPRARWTAAQVLGVLSGVSPAAGRPSVVSGLRPQSTSTPGLLEDLDRLLNGDRDAASKAPPAAQTRPKPPLALQADLQAFLDQRYPGR
jgi:serine/threonine protein kinase